MKFGVKIRWFVVLLFCCLISFSQNKDLSEDITVGLHKVEAGETLYRLSKKFFLTEKDILELNPGLTAQNLKAGQTIKVPITVRNKEFFASSATESVTQVHNNTLTVHKKPKKKIDKKTKLNIAILLPLNYEEIDKLTFTKFNIDEKKRLRYKCFEYINFYEGARIALDVIEKSGYKVDCYVYDVGENDLEEMHTALNSAEMKDMDLIIPLVFKQNFSVVAQFAKEHKIPVVNPMSADLAILNNAYTFKIQPSPATEVETIVRHLRAKHADDNIIILYDNNGTAKASADYFEQLLSKSNMMFSIMDYGKYSGKVPSKISLTKKNVVIMLTDRNEKADEDGFVKKLLSLLATKKTADISLFGNYSWCETNSVDLSLLEKFNFHFTLSYLSDYTNANFVNFVKEYRKHFKTEPDKIYAALGYDIVTYFVHSLIENGDEFMDNPNTNSVDGMINPFHFERKGEEGGYQNKRTVLYEMEGYKIKSVGR